MSNERPRPTIAPLPEPVEAGHVGDVLAYVVEKTGLWVVGALNWALHKAADHLDTNNPETDNHKK